MSPTDSKKLEPETQQLNSAYNMGEIGSTKKCFAKLAPSRTLQDKVGECKDLLGITGLYSES